MRDKIVEFEFDKSNCLLMDINFLFRHHRLLLVT